MLIETFGFSPAVATAIAFLVFLLCALVVLWVVRSAPSRTLVLSSGPEGSSFHRWAKAYQKALTAHGVAVEIRTSAGSLENFERMQDPASGVDIAFVASGLVKDANLTGLVSLGSISTQPIWVYYRAEKPIARLSELQGRRITVGVPGSGTRLLAMTLLQANGIQGAPTIFLDQDSTAAATDLLEGRVDAVFLMGDSASLRTLRSLGRAPGIQLFSFDQADAYVRRLQYLTRLELPKGSIDLGQNLPAEDVVLVGPTVELVAREGLNSAHCDMLLEAARGIHGRPGLLQRRGEFPAAIEHELPLSQDALRYYKSGSGFLYRALGSYWLASLANRVLVAIVPLFLLLFPAFRLLPMAYRLSIQLRLYRCYRPLLRVEHETFGPLTRERISDLQRKLDEIEVTVNALNVPASFADRYYWLRSHLAFVRQRLTNLAPSGS